MKKLFLTFSSALVLTSFLFALPLTALIFQESAKLADKVAAWNRQCGGKASYDEACDKKRYEISGELGKFVAMVNDELAIFRNISPNATADFVRESTGRRKIMELEARNALHVINCLGVPANDTQCAGEAAAIEAEKNTLQAEYKESHAIFDQKWIFLPAKIEVSPAPKKR
jgi:hypothetical protein